MREASSFDFWSSFHYVASLILILAVSIEIYALWRSFKNRRYLSVAFIFTSIIVTLFISLSIWMSFFPSGGLNDTRYKHDLMTIYFLQEKLNAYKENCHNFPTTEQGVRALREKPIGIDCANYKPLAKYFPYVKYTSDGKNYVLESDREYGIKGLIARGTSETQARLYIKETEVK